MGDSAKDTGRHVEIGSIYEMNPSLFDSQDVGRSMSFILKETGKYHKANILYTQSGREAIGLALKCFAYNHPESPKRCLLPAYMCDTVFFPFERAGWEMHFYHLDRRMRADADELNRLIEQIRPGMIFIHPYYGVDTWESIRSFLPVWRARGIYIMEDVSQSYYLENVGAEADYCVGSLRKWYAVTDGGFLACDEAILGEGIVPNREFVDKRRELLTEKWIYLHEKRGTQEGQALKEDYLKKNREMEDWLDAYAGISAMSTETSAILSGVDEETCKRRREDNCGYLHRHLRNMAQIVPVFGEGYEKAAPLYYPVYAKDRDGLQYFLKQHDIYAPTLWLVGEENKDCLSVEEGYIYRHILALPIDQRYGAKEMQRIVEVLGQYERDGVSRTQEYREEAGGFMHKTGPTDRQVTGIRVDANETVATGHVMRCITIAKQLMLLGQRVLFFTADEYAAEMLEQAGMEYICLHTEWNRMEEEVDLLCRKLRETGCGRLLVDSYQATAKYFEALHNTCKIIYIDDCFEEIYPVDMVINYNAYHVLFPYEEAYEGKSRLLLGTAYVPLREEFGDNSGKYGCAFYHKQLSGTEPGCEKAAEDKWDKPEDVGKRQVLLSSGGGDLCDALPGILLAAVKDDMLRHVVFHTVVGGFNRNVEELKRIAEKYPNIRLHCQVEHMAKLMGECTAAVSAAGTMLFELSAMQVPTVFFVSADNQKYDSEFFAAEERMLFAGDIRENREACLETVCSQLKEILEDRAMRRRMKRKLYEVTDGKGARRIAEAIVGM